MNAITTAPATTPANPHRILALLFAAGYGQFTTIEDDSPVIVRYIGPQSEHTAHVAGFKHILELCGYDLATRGPIGAEYLAVYTQYDSTAA